MDKKENKYKGKVVKILCNECGTITNHTILHSQDQTIVETEGEYLVWAEETSYQIVECNGCESTSFRKYYTNIDMEGIDEDDFEESVFPKRISGRRILKDNRYIPPLVRNIYLETHDAINNELKVLTGIGIRALTEAICLEKKAKGNNLKEKIDSLVTTGDLTKADSEILHKIRNLGNKSTHEIQPHPIEDLSLAMDILEHMMAGVYIYPKKKFSDDDQT